ncbi:glutathione S-transferase C-terminal-like protein [Rhizoctonia solani]|nr:glutathione S-transferase C-terminal-like protein [Rhizoctonia solani]
MATIGTLYTTDRQPHAGRIRATAAWAGVKLDEAQGYVHGETNKTAEYKAKFLPGKIPAFETKDGFTLFEGSAIARYIASLAPNSGLLGTSPTDAALVDQWVSHVDSEFLGPSTTLIQLCHGVYPYNKPTETVLREKIHSALTVLNNHLTYNTFFLPTNRISLADISAAAVFVKGCEMIFGPEERAKYPALVRHMETVVNQPTLKDVFGPIKYAEASLKFVPPKKEKAPAA